MTTLAKVDLSSCDQEQVQFCGAVQPHGVLLVLSEPELSIRQLSANARTMLGIEPRELLGRSIEQILGPEQTDQFRQAVAQVAHLTGPPRSLLTAKVPGPLQEARLLTHRNDQGLLCVELERVGQQAPVSQGELYSEIRASLDDLQRTVSLQSFFDLAVSRIRRFTGYDRVLAYKFLDDGSGWVLAENRDQTLESYVGLHYPASDIPEPARRLFSMKWVSHLPDVDYEPVPLVTTDRSEAPLDLSYSYLRSVSVMYSGYLRNMGVRSTMVLTLLKHGKLWGLISCMHHRGPKHVSYEARTAAEFLAHLLSLAMASKEELEDQEYASDMQTLNTKMMEQMLQHVDFHEGLLQHETNLLSYFNATGAAVFLDDQVYRLGDSPTEPQLRAILAWMESHVSQNQFATDRLPALYPPAREYQGIAAGMLALRLSPHVPHFIVWFRPEIERTVSWAGDPHKPVSLSAIDGDTRLMPRTSFALWKEAVKGAGQPWRESELSAAADLRRTIVNIVLRRAEQLARANVELTRSNLELDAFAYIASHDLKEPLRGIHNYARFVLEDYADNLDEEGQSRLRTMMKLTERMDELIGGLLHYSRLGRQELEKEATDLLVLINRVVQSLVPRLNELGVTVRLPPSLPIVMANPVMLQEMFANLITNAMKYNDKSEKWIEIGSLPAASVANREKLGLQDEGVIYVKDNGIGIPHRHFETIFQMFRRLHGREQYGGGTGVGLSIAKKIVERHGGQIWVESEVGQGTCFFISLPQRLVME